MPINVNSNAKIMVFIELFLIKMCINLKCFTTSK